jgi:hypothetical protein
MTVKVQIFDYQRLFQEDLQQNNIEMHIVYSSDELFINAIEFAAKCYCLPTNLVVAPEDDYSKTYVITQNNQVCGTITVTWAINGQLEAEAFMPDHLLHRYHDKLCTAYRLAVEPKGFPKGFLASLLMRYCFAHGLSCGMRIAIAAIKPELLEYYQNVGYFPFGADTFQHPRLDSPHTFVLCPADSDRDSLFQDLCSLIDDPISKDAIISL